jgi:hypothetical protein
MINNDLCFFINVFVKMKIDRNKFHFCQFQKQIYDFDNNFSRSTLLLFIAILNVIRMTLRIKYFDI